MLTIAWQPIVDLVSGKVVGYEALGRVKGRENEGFAAVRAVFASQRQRAQALSTLQRLALRKLGRQPPGTALFLNASLGRLDELSRLKDFEGSERLDGLVLEVPEQGGRLDIWEASLAPLRARGAKVAIDDWGVGAADPLRLIRLQPDWIKLDVALVQQIGTRPEADRLVQLLVRWTDPAVTQVIAEGIELSQQIWRLRELGVRFGQGYALARPGPRWRARVTVPAKTERLRDLPPAVVGLAKVVGVSESDLTLFRERQGILNAVAVEVAKSTTDWIAQHAIGQPLSLYSSPDRLEELLRSHLHALWRGTLDASDVDRARRIALVHSRLSVSWSWYALAHRKLTTDAVKSLRARRASALADAIRRVLDWDEGLVLSFLQQEVEEDPASSLLSRAAFAIRAQAEVDRCVTRGQSGALLALEIPSLHRMSPLASDRLSREIGARLRPFLDYSVLIGRWNTAVFVVWMGAVGPETSRRLERQIRRTLHDTVGGRLWRMGMVRVPEHGVVVEGLVDLARRVARDKGGRIGRSAMISS